MARTRAIPALAVLASASAALALDMSAHAPAPGSPPPPVVPGKVIPSYPQQWQMNKSTAIMICNSTGPVDAGWAKQWHLVDIDWNSDKVQWSATKPMSNEEEMIANVEAIVQANPDAITWVYR